MDSNSVEIHFARLLSSKVMDGAVRVNVKTLIKNMSGKNDETFSEISRLLMFAFARWQGEKDWTKDIKEKARKNRKTELQKYRRQREKLREQLIDHAQMLQKYGKRLSKTDAEKIIEKEILSWDSPPTAYGEFQGEATGKTSILVFSLCEIYEKSTGTKNFRYASIAKLLNYVGITNTRGGEYTRESVRNIVQRHLPKHQEQKELLKGIPKTLGGITRQGKDGTTL